MVKMTNVPFYRFLIRYDDIWSFFVEKMERETQVQR